MKRNRLNHGELIAAVSAILLLVLMFLDWFGVTLRDHSNLLYLLVLFPPPGKSAWQALDYIPIVLLLSIVAALSLPALSMKATRKPSMSTYLLVALLGIVSVLLILYRIVDPPSFGSYPDGMGGTVTREGTVQFPIFLALAAAAGIAVGGCLAMRGELHRPRRPKREPATGTTPETDAT
jgi:hypothetical protein